MALRTIYRTDGYRTSKNVKINSLQIHNFHLMLGEEVGVLSVSALVAVTEHLLEERGTTYESALSSDTSRL